LHRVSSGTGGGPAVLAKLTDLEHRVLNLIGVTLEEAWLSEVLTSLDNLFQEDNY